jgi:hypothetical protein
MLAGYDVEAKRHQVHSMLRDPCGEADSNLDANQNHNVSAPGPRHTVFQGQMVLLGSCPR